MNRQPFPDIDAIYFISPTKASLDKVLLDFDPVAKYKSANLFFTSSLSQDLFTRLAQSKCAMFVEQFQEVYVDFLMYEQNLFTFSGPAADIKYNKFLDAGISERLAAVCVSLNCNPTVIHDSKINSKTLATNFIETMNDLAAKIKTELTTPAKLLIIDRSYDLVSPLIHDLHLQSLCLNLLELDKIFEYSDASKDRSLILEGEFWDRLKSKHIAECIEIIRKENNRLVAEGKIFEQSDLKSALSALPQFNARKQTIVAYTKLIQECMTKFERGNLKLICDLEQDLCLNEDDVFDRLIQTLKQEDVQKQDKIRLLLIYLILRGFKESEMETINLLDQETLAMLNSIQVFTGDFAKENFDKYKCEANPNDKFDYFHVPKIKTILSELICDSLDEEQFQILKKQTSKEKFSLRKKKITSKIIVFVIGGVSPSEIRVANDFSNENDCEVVLGSSDLLTSEDFLSYLANCKQKEFFKSQ